MKKIQVLDQMTIDKIAAGEVIERPSSVVKELVENAIDAQATMITTEIKEGGISFMRIADNGCGIEKEDIRPAFLRHSTSKIHSAEDLFHISSLGFRGEALSSIAAVARVELATKTREEPFGARYCIAGGREESLEEAGVPDGTTFIVRQLFYNTPARKKFLKTGMTEAGHVSDLLIRLALSHPEISFRFINNGQEKLHTSGNGNLQEVIYHIYGREIAAGLLPVRFEKGNLQVAGFIGKPSISRGNRNFENYFVGGRYIRSSLLSRAVEDAYRDFSMQHKYPFVVLHIEVSGEELDVNVHPTKMEVRFHNPQETYNTVFEAVSRTLHGTELIPQVTADVLPDGDKASGKPEKEMEKKPGEEKPARGKDQRDLSYFMEEMRKRVRSYHEQNAAAETPGQGELFRPERQTARIRETVSYAAAETPRQMSLFEDRLLTPAAREAHKIIGQVFDTYWLVEYHDSLYIIDQHAAHERVLYERTLQSMKTREYTSQMISPPIILDLTMQEAELLSACMEPFTKIGFAFEEFGQNSYAVRAVPDNLFGIAKKELLIEMLDNLSSEINRNAPVQLIDEKVASMSCKAAVKGNMQMSAAEADALIGELLSLENPYHCPHGRPTIIAMSKKELEKKFKRIV